MSWIMGQIESEHPELFALEFGKMAESDCLHSSISTNINQSVPNLVKIYVTIRSWMSSIMDLIKPELFFLNFFFHDILILEGHNLTMKIKWLKNLVSEGNKDCYEFTNQTRTV